MAKKVIFVRSFKGVSKKSGKEYQSVTLAEFDGARAFLKDFFVPVDLVLDFVFGDTVECEWQESRFMGGSPDLVGLKLLEETPFV